MSDLKNGFVPCHPFHHHLNPRPLDEKNCAMPPFHHHLHPHPLDEKTCQGVGVEAGMVVEGWHGTKSPPGYPPLLPLCIALNPAVKKMSYYHICIQFQH